MAPIATIEHFRVLPRWLFVKITDTEGHVGWGEATLEGHTEAIEGTLHGYAKRFTGLEADDIEEIWQQAWRKSFYRGGPVFMSALSGIDIALWDLKARKLGVPVWQLLGGKVRERVAVYAWIGGDRPSDIESAAKGRQMQGFKAIKMNATEDGPLFIEEPLLSEHPEGIKELYGLTTCPIALGERLYSRWDFKRFFEDHSVDIIQPDISHCGGISEMRRIAAMAEAYDVALAPHCPLGPIALAACLQIGICTPNHQIQEMSLGMHYNVLAGEYDINSYITNPEVFDVKDGFVEKLTGPGLGVEINEELVRKVAETTEPWPLMGFVGKDGAYREW
ncbi:hypothetical protein LTR91_009156 [Friedmanniomyces endolithicus]|uniref:Mandelate racemase/muconate lactonizing enzyme C-terminal domain-containing protein n=1 Tax=Friedmanniomyces endolithicus TaxID=329885 RepID=A0AAN6QTD5_9PEZI|nr:hypothetical protein LTR94_012918 [Friedmanniomyces endolithicus]KAK0782935.1 hypothetical protein LTR59_011997 [Friedmanniomyces endolithicus]KAK0802670.1 hypothetical protein LTR75_008241 [Friedmanniomyces endolithicus]KAK0803326.1 hypothetical protein LTR38_006186 [Friedmanniomyces endolithicus]KAK0832579.1 hypothetical protein LTR03_015093 [Friedmanniomyces endolithicus]